MHRRSYLRKALAATVVTGGLAGCAESGSSTTCCSASVPRRRRGVRCRRPSSNTNAAVPDRQRRDALHARRPLRRRGLRHRPRARSHRRRRLPLSEAVATGRRLDVRETTSWAERAYVFAPDTTIDREAIEEKRRTADRGVLTRRARRHRRRRSGELAGAPGVTAGKPLRRRPKARPCPPDERS